MARKIWKKIHQNLWIRRKNLTQNELCYTTWLEHSTCAVITYLKNTHFLKRWKFISYVIVSGRHWYTCDTKQRTWYVWWYSLTFMFSVMSFKYLSHVVLFWILKYTNALLNLYLTASNTRILCCCGAWYYCVTHLQLCHEKYNTRKT